MNGDTKQRLWGGFIGGILVLLLSLLSATYGYGQLNNRVCSNEDKLKGMQEVKERLVRVETIVERIDKKLP